MSNVIGFLETVGQDAELRHATNNEMELALSEAQIDPGLKAAILQNDLAKLVALLGARTNLVCGVFPGKEDDDEEEEEGPTPDDDEISASRRAVSHMASSR